MSARRHRTQTCAVLLIFPQDQIEEEAFFSVIDFFLNCACFVYIGAWLPFSVFNSPELGITPWRLSVLLILILALRRIPPLLMLYRWVPEIKTWKEALFSEPGYFGKHLRLPQLTCIE
jgi:sodium/hydrogen antiporter